MDEVRIGEFYTLNQNELCQIITVATHAKTQQKLIIYQELFGTFAVYALPIEDFLSICEKQSERKTKDVFLEKVPNLTEETSVDDKINEDNIEPNSNDLLDEPKHEQPQVSEVKQEKKVDNKYRFIDENPKTLMDFLDADTNQERLDILHQMHSYIDSFTLDSITVSLDYVPNGTSLDERYYSVCKYLEMKINYESRRKR